MHHDLARLQPYPDHHTAELIDETLELLGQAPATGCAAP